MDSLSALWKWVTQFDVVKGVILAIAVVVSSWYDLKAEVGKNGLIVQEIREDMARRWIQQNYLDSKQDETARMQREDMKQSLDDIKQELRMQRRERLAAPPQKR